MTQSHQSRASQSGGHGTRTRSRLPGTSVPVKLLTNSLTLRCAFWMALQTAQGFHRLRTQRSGDPWWLIAGPRSGPGSLPFCRHFSIGRGSACRIRGPADLKSRLCSADQLDEFVVAFEATELLGQLLHGITGMHARKRPPQHRDGFVRFFIMQ